MANVLTKIARFFMGRVCDRMLLHLSAASTVVQRKSNGCKGGEEDLAELLSGAMT